MEVRISGDDLGTLGEIGHKVEQILRDTKGSIFVENNFREYAMQLKLDVDNEVANRLGLTNASIATQLAGGFQGAPVTTFWEGDRAVDVLLRLDPNQRQSFDNIRDTYLTSQLTRGARAGTRDRGPDAAVAAGAHRASQRRANHDRRGVLPARLPGVTDPERGQAEDRRAGAAVRLFASPTAARSRHRKTRSAR